MLIKRGIENFGRKKKRSTNLPHANFIEVENPLLALQNWAKIHRKQFHFPVIWNYRFQWKNDCQKWLNQLLWKKFSIVVVQKVTILNWKTNPPVLQMEREKMIWVF